MESAGLVIRPALKGDVDGVIEAHVRSIGELARSHYSQDQIEAWIAGSSVERVRSWIEQDGFFVAVTGSGTIAGIAMLRQEESRLGLLYVHPLFAGTGVGRALCDHIEAEARRAGLDSLTLESSMNAVGFYERMGYERVEPVVRVLNGVEFDCVRMTKSLGG